MESDNEDGGFFFDEEAFSVMRSKTNKDEVPNCVVCIEPLGKHGGPASLPCGHNGCLECLQKVQVHSPTPLCPLCRSAFDPEIVLGPNLELKAALEAAAAVKAPAQLAPYPPLPRYDSRSTPVFGAATPVALGQRNQDISVRNVITGLFTLLTKGGTKRSEASTGDNRDAWASVLLPSAPPLLSGGSEEIQAMQSLLGAEPPEWLPDSSTRACLQCSAIFRPLTCGRHHCRFCGGIFCRVCSRGRSLMPAKFREREPQRVCDACYERLEPVQGIICDNVSNASQRATHDVTDLTCLRSWLNTPYGLSMEQEIYKATNALRSYAQVGRLSPEKGIPEAVLRGALGVAIITVIKAGVVLTYKFGTGLVVTKLANGSWSAPSAVATIGLGWGAQAGGELTDFLVVLRTPEAVKAFSGRLHFSCGAGLSAAAGPIGRLAEAEIRASVDGTAACYTYSLSKGAFIGVSIEGSIVVRRGDTNARFYGDPYITSQDILSGVCPAPRAGEPLYSALRELFDKDD